MSKYNLIRAKYPKEKNRDRYMTIPETKSIYLKIRSQIRIPIVVDVMDASKPNIQENGSEMAIAPEPIFLTCS